MSPSQGAHPNPADNNQPGAGVLAHSLNVCSDPARASGIEFRTYLPGRCAASCENGGRYPPMSALRSRLLWPVRWPTCTARDSSIAILNPLTLSATDGYTARTRVIPKGLGTVFRIQLLPPASSPISLQAGLVTNRNFTLGFRSTAGQSYTLELNTDLNTTNWIDYTNFTGDGSFLQPLVPASHSAEFFRVRTP